MKKANGCPVCGTNPYNCGCNVFAVWEAWEDNERHRLEFDDDLLGDKYRFNRF